MITVIGSINMDLIATVRRLPKPGETLAGTSFSTAAGGKGANQALAARRSGSEVAMVGAVGDDSFADTALMLLDSAGTDLSAVRRVAGPTGIASIHVGTEDGDNVIIVVEGANGTVSARDAADAVAAMPDGVLLMQLEIPAASVEAALDTARARGIRTMLNVAPLTEEAARLAEKADIVVANESEFGLLSDKSFFTDEALETALHDMHAQRRQTVVVTLGAAGAVAIHKGLIIRAGGLEIDPIDTVGAGDTFCGYLASGLDRGLDFDTALKRAAIAGSLACLKPGAQPSIPMAEAVEAALS